MRFAAVLPQVRAARRPPPQASVRDAPPEMFAPIQIQGIGFGESQPAQSPDSTGKRPARAEETCLPVTIRAVEAALAQRTDPGEDLNFFGAQPGVLVLVAIVEGVVRQSTGLEMTLNDSTGRLRARYFVTEPLPGELDAIQPGRYVSLFGSMRSAPTPHFAANGVRLVDCADEASVHLMEAAYTMLRLQQPAEPAFAKASDSEPPQTPQKSAPEMQEVAAPATSPTHPASLQGAELQAAVTEVLSASGSAEGLTIAAIAEKVGRGVAAAEVQAAVSALVEEAQAYLTVDEDHFAVV